MSHKLRTPLNGIFGFTGLPGPLTGDQKLPLIGRPSDERDCADITRIRKAGLRASGLTRQLLAFSRKEIIEPTRLDMNAIVSDLLPMLERLIGEDVKVVLVLRPELSPVVADRGQIEQIVMNLAVNARDAMTRGGTLTIETANIELDEHYARTHLKAKPGSYVALARKIREALDR